jgi:hypothetical protein
LLLRGAPQVLSVDFEDLEEESVQMERMGHHCGG